MSAPLTKRGAALAPVSSASPVLSVPTPLPVPEREVLAGRYELLALLGVGSMGSVYRAWDRELDDVVALKMLRRELMASREMLERFRTEVKLARRVTHKNVARVFDIGEHDGLRFLTMELVEGTSLEAIREREGYLPIARVVDLATQICGGLAAAHAAGVVHRDLKPDNIVVDPNGRAVIADFGIARALAGTAKDARALSGMAGMVGTPAYMAPEQVEGTEPIDGRADIYAFGAMLFELFTGELPFPGDTPLAVAIARLRGDAPDVRTRRADIPERVARIVAKCMAREPSERYATSAELFAQLDRLRTSIAADPVAAMLPSVNAIPVAVPSSPRSVASLTMLEEVAFELVPTARPVVKMVAVLPFKILGDVADAYLADALTEDLIDTLSVTEGLRVRTRGSVARFRGMDTDPRDAGRALDAQVVVSGTLSAVGERLCVTARAVSVADGYQLWATRFERPGRDVVAIADEAANALSDVLTVSRAKTERRAPGDPVALDLYLRGRHEHNTFFRAGNAQAVDLLRLAHHRAPDDPTIMASYAVALMRRFALEDAASDVAETAQKLAVRALALSPDRADAHVALAGLHLSRGELGDAARHLGRALTLAPTLADAQEMAGQLLIELGPLDEGVLRLEAAVALEPRLFEAQYRRARGLALRGDWSASDGVFRLFTPDNDDVCNAYWLTRIRLAMWRRQRSQADGFVREIGERKFYFRGLCLELCGLLARREGPRTILSRLDAFSMGASPRRRAFLAQIRAEVLAFAGETDDALDALATADSAGLLDLVWLDACPLFADLQDDVRFFSVRARVAARGRAALEAFEEAR